ncbi:hypothetical protein HDU76_003883, partial [Blyttiomyces sp. JEL0837]
MIQETETETQQETTHKVPPTTPTPTSESLDPPAKKRQRIDISRDIRSSSTILSPTTSTASASSSSNNSVDARTTSFKNINNIALDSTPTTPTPTISTTMQPLLHLQQESQSLTPRSPKMILHQVQHHQHQVQQTPKKKPITHRRAQQNRDAQRNFRERRKQYIRALEAQVSHLEKLLNDRIHDDHVRNGNIGAIDYGFVPMHVQVQQMQAAAAN